MNVSIYLSIVILQPVKSCLSVC